MFGVTEVLKSSLFVAGLDIRVLNFGNFRFTTLDVTSASLFVNNDASRQILNNSFECVFQNRSALLFWYLKLVLIALILNVLDAEDELSKLNVNYPYLM